MNNTPEIEDLRFVVFLLDRKYHEHEGIVFVKYKDAIEFVNDELTNYPENKVIIASFLEVKGTKEMYMSKVQTFGFKGDKKFNGQTSLF